jgi:hypothetical protein
MGAYPGTCFPFFLENILVMREAEKVELCAPLFLVKEQIWQLVVSSTLL